MAIEDSIKDIIEKADKIVNDYFGSCRTQEEERLKAEAFTFALKILGKDLLVQNENEN